MQKKNRLSRSIIVDYFMEYDERWALSIEQSQVDAINKTCMKHMLSTKTRNELTQFNLMEPHSTLHRIFFQFQFFRIFFSSSPKRTEMKGKWKRDNNASGPDRIKESKKNIWGSRLVDNDSVANGRLELKAFDSETKGHTFQKNENEFYRHVDEKKTKQTDNT